MKIKLFVFGHILFFAALFLVGGCARQHSVKTDGNMLIFHYLDATAKEIILATSQDNFHYHPATKIKGDLWEVGLPLVKEFTYFYIVDGQVRLPDCSDKVLDDFEGKNCFYSHTM